MPGTRSAALVAAVVCTCLSSPATAVCRAAAPRTATTRAVLNPAHLAQVLSLVKFLRRRLAENPATAGMDERTRFERLLDMLARLGLEPAGDMKLEPDMSDERLAVALLGYAPPHKRKVLVKDVSLYLRTMERLQRRLDELNRPRILYAVPLSEAGTAESAVSRMLEEAVEEAAGPSSRTTTSPLREEDIEKELQW